MPGLQPKRAVRCTVRCTRTGKLYRGTICPADFRQQTIQTGDWPRLICERCSKAEEMAAQHGLTYEQCRSPEQECGDGG